MIRLILTLLISLALCGPVLAKQAHPEKWYQSKWCAENQGKAEVVLPDRTRCDCLTEKHAIEVEFANKWKEAIGQSLHYSLQTGKRAGIVLIMEKQSDIKYWISLNKLIKAFNLPIDIWKINPQNVR